MLGKLIALSKNGEEKQSLPVVNLHFFIGSDLFCDLRINHKDIAAQHCLITSQKNKPALIRNLSRTVPTLVNNNEIGSSDVELKNNDIIAIRHKNYKWCYESSSSPSTSSQSSFVVNSRNRKSWPLFKNKLVAVVPPQRRDEQNEGPPKKRRGTIAGGEENISKSKTTPKVVAIKTGLRATSRQKFGKRKSSVKNSPNITLGERTPKVLPSLNRKSVKFLDTASAPRSRLGTRGSKSSYATPYKCTPAKQKVSVYSTPPSSFRHDKKKPIKSILKTPSSSSTTPRKDEDEKQRVLETSDILSTPLSNVAEVSGSSPLLPQNDLLQTPVKGNQPEIVMRSSKRKAAIIRSPPSTPKSITKKRKSPEEKSIEASERAAKKLKKVPPHAIDKKKRAALLQCHRKSLTPHPVARRSGKLITNFPSSFSSRLETNSPARTTVSSKFSNSRKSDSFKLSSDLLTPTVLKYSSLGKSTDSEVIIHSNTASTEKKKRSSRKNSKNSLSKTSPIVKKFTRSSRAARISNSLPPKTDATDVLSALDLSRRWPSSPQGERCANNSSQDVSNLSGFKKLFSVDKTLDVRELFLETSSETDNATEKCSLSLPEDQLGRVSRSCAMLKGNQTTDKEGLLHSFQSEEAHDLPCSVSLLSGSLSSLPSYSSTSRRSLSLKRGRKSTLSPKDINLPLVDQSTEEQQSQSIGKKTTQSLDNNSFSFSRKGRRSISILNGSPYAMHSSKSLNITDEINKKSIDTNHFSSPLNGTLSMNNFDECNDSQKCLNHSSSDVSVFSLGSFNSSYHKSRSGDSSFLSQASDKNFVDKDTFLEDSVGSESAKDVHVITPESGKGHPKGRISLRRAVLLASTPKPGKLPSSNKESLLPLELETEETSIEERSSNELQMNQYRNISTDIASGKLKKTMKKGKGFISKSYLQSASLPLTADSSVLKNLSAISTSVADLRTTRSKTLCLNGSKLESPKTSKNLINNNINDSVTELCTNEAGSISFSEKNIIDDPSISIQSKQILISCASPIDTRTKETCKSFNKRSIDILYSSINSSLGKRTRSYKDNLGYSQHEESQYLKKGSLSLPSADNQTTPKQNSMILHDPILTRRSSRKADDSKINKILGASPSSPSALRDNPIYEKEDGATPIINTTPINHTESRGRPSKLSVSADNSKLDKSAMVKKRSRSLPTADQITPQQISMILHDPIRPRRSSRKADDSKINKLLDASSSSPSALSDYPISNKEDGGTPVIDTSTINSKGRRGRPSKLSVNTDNSKLDKSATVKKRSRSLSTADQRNPQQNPTILQDSVHPRRSRKKAIDGATPIIESSSLNNSGRRGRPSELRVGADNSQLEKSIVKKRSRSLPSADDQIIPQQTSMIMQGHPRRSSRKGHDSKINNTMLHALSSSSSALPDNAISGKEVIATPIINKTPINHTRRSGRPSTLSVGNQINNKEDGATPVNNTTSINSTGRRGKPSKLSVSVDNSQLEKSAIVKKRPQSLPSTEDQITTQQISMIVQDSDLPRRSSRKADDGKITETMLEASTTSPSILHDHQISNKGDGPIPVIDTTINSTRSRGRLSKLSVGTDNYQLEKSAIVKKRSRSLPSADDQITPQQSSMIMQDSGQSRCGSKKAIDGATPIIESSSHNNSGRRGRPSKRSVGADNSQLEKSAIDKKHSRNLASADDKITPQQTSMIVQSHPRHSSKRDIDGDTPIIERSTLNISGRSGRLSKLSVGTDNSQLEKSATVKKRSRSLPSADDKITPQQTSMIVQDAGQSRHSSKRDIDGDTPTIERFTLNTSGRRGRPSKLSVSADNSQLEKSATVKKRSRSLPSADDKITPQQTSMIVQDAGQSRHSSKRDIDGDTPTIERFTLNTSGRRGRPSKLSVSADNSQLEKSATVKKRSRSLPSADDKITPQQTSMIVQDAGQSRHSSKRDIDGDTPTIERFTLNTSGRRGRPSKLNVSADNSQLEKSAIVKKRSRSLPSADDKITPQQTSMIVQDAGQSRHSSKRDIDGDTPTIERFTLNTSGRRGRPSKLNVSADNSQLEKSAIVKKSSRSLLSGDDQITPQQTSMIMPDSGHRRRSNRKANDGDTPIIESSSHNNSGRRGRPSKRSVGADNSQLEKSAIVKKRSRSLPSADQITPQQTSMIVQDSGQSRRSSKKDIDGDTPIIGRSTLNTSERRGRPSKLNVSADNSLLEKSSIVKKSSRSLLSEDDQITPQQTSMIMPDSGHRRCSNRKANDGDTPIIESSSHNNSGRRGRPSKRSVGADNSQLEKSAIVKKSSRSLLSADDQITPQQTSMIMPDSGQLRRSNRKANDGDTPIIESSSHNNSGKRGRPSKRSVGADNSQLEKSAIVNKRSRSLPSADQITPQQTSMILQDSGQSRRSSKKDIDGDTPIIERSTLNTSGRRGRPSKLSVSADNSLLEKSAIVKKSSRSLPSADDQITPQQTSMILPDSGHPRRSSRIADDGALPVVEISFLNNSGRAGRLSKHTGTINDKSKEISLKEYNMSQNLASRTSMQHTSVAHSVLSFEEIHHKRKIVRKTDNIDYEASTLTSSFDHCEDRSVTAGNQNKVEKSKKRKFEEVSPVSVPLRSISSVAKKKLKTSNSGSFPVFSDSILNNKRPSYFDSEVGNSKKFSAFSSTPIIAKNPYLIDNCGEKNRSRCKLRNIQSPVGLSPIICGNEADFSANDENSQISMICLRHSQCPSYVGGKNTSDSLIINSNMLFETNRPHNDTNSDVKNSSNRAKNNTKGKLSKKSTSSLSTTQNRLPLIQQTPVASQLPAMKEDKLSPQPRKSDYGLSPLHESQKDKVINITSDFKSNTPIIKLSPGKSRTRSRKVVEEMKSIEEKEQHTIKHETLCSKEMIAHLGHVSDNNLTKRRADYPESKFHNELSSNLKRVSGDKNSIMSPEGNAPVTLRRGRPKKRDNPEINKSPVNKVLQRRGRSAKNINLSSPLDKSEAPDQKMSKNKKQKTVVAEDLSSSSKQHKIENISSKSDQTISGNRSDRNQIDQKSPTSFPKTRSKVAVLALKTPRKSVISSSIVKSPFLNRPRVKKIKSENVSSQPGGQKKGGHSAKEASINVTSEDQNVLLTNSNSTNRGIKRGKNKVKNSSPKLTDNLEKQNFILSPIKRRGRSAVHNSSSRNEKLVAKVSKQDLVATSPHLPKRGRFIKAQGIVNNISTKEKDLNEFNEEPSTLGTKPKRGRPKKNPVNDNESNTSTSLPKKEKTPKVQDSNLSISGKKPAQNISERVEGENISLRRGRSVVKISDSLNKRGRPKKDKVNINGTVASPSPTVAKRGRRGKVEDVNTTASSKEHGKKTSVSGESKNTYLRRGRSVVKNSGSSPNQRVKPKKDPVSKNETITSPSLPKREKPSNKVQGRATTDSGNKPNIKGSDKEKIQTDINRRGRSAVKDLHPLPDKTRKLITLQCEGDANCDVDSTLPKRGRSAKRKAKNTSESTEDLSSLPLQKRRSSVVKNSDFYPVKAGTKNSKTKQTNNCITITSPSSPKKGRPAKIQKGTLKGTINEVSKSSDNQNISLQRRGRSAALEENSLSRQEQETSKNIEPQISSSKKGRAVVLENVSPPRRGRSEASKHTSPLLVKNKMVNTENKTKLPSRRGKKAPSPQPEVRKVSDRSKAIKKNSKKENRPLKSAIKKSLSKRLSRKSSLLGFTNHGRRKVHFNKNVVRNSNSKKK